MKKIVLLSILFLFTVTVGSRAEAYTEKKSADIAYVSQGSPVSNAIIGDAEITRGVELPVRHEAGAGWWSVLLLAGAFAGSRVKPKKEIWGILGMLGFCMLTASIVSLFSSVAEGVMMAGMTILPAKLVVDGQEVPPLTRSQKKLYDFLRMKGNPITLEALLGGAIKWDNITYYIRTTLTGLNGRQPVLNSSVSEVLGICNLDKGQLPQYYNFCYDRIEIGYAVDAAASTSPKAVAGYSSVLSSMAPGLRNGELIVQLNREVQVESPVTDYGSKAAITGGAALNFDGGELADPQVWQEQLQVEVDINLAAVIPSAANNTYVAEFLFKGCQARLR